MRKQPLAKGAPAVVRKWRRVAAIGCSHGHLAQQDRLDEIIAFRHRFQPEIRFDLGDLIDTAAFRSGAKGTKDEAEPIEPDKFAATEWIRRWEPTHITWGNHDIRPYDLMTHYNAQIAFAAGTVWRKLEDAAKEVGAKTLLYDVDDGWFYMGGVYWGHGYQHNEAAVRDTAEYHGGRVVMAHLHRPLMELGRTRRDSTSFCVGLLGDPKKLLYARRRRGFSRWTAGCVFGELCEEESALWLASAPKGQPIHFPPGI